MNCKEFETTLNDIAREARTDATSRAAAEEHAAECQPCAALLSDARSLTAGLRAFAAESAATSAPPRVESNLLAAFRAQKAATATTAATAAAVVDLAACERRPPTADDSTATAATTTGGAPVVIPFAAKRWSWTKTFGAAGLAAAAAVALVVLVPQMFDGPQQARPTADQTASRQPSQKPSQTNIGRPSEAQMIIPPGVNEPDDSIRKQQTQATVANAPRANRGGVTMTSVKYGGGGGTRNNVALPSASPAAAAAERPEITTAFIPLVQGGGFVAGEGGHVIRVELPRSALAQFGLPVNADRSDGRVKADVLLGDDGMARAIRFVR